MSSYTIIGKIIVLNDDTVGSLSLNLWSLDKSSRFLGMAVSGFVNLDDLGMCVSVIQDDLGRELVFMLSSNGTCGWTWRKHLVVYGEKK